MTPHATVAASAPHRASLPYAAPTDPPAAHALRTERSVGYGCTGSPVGVQKEWGKRGEGSRRPRCSVRELLCQHKKGPFFAQGSMAFRGSLAVCRGVDLVRLPASAFQLPHPAAQVHKRPTARFRHAFFTLSLYPLQLAVPPNATSMPRAFGPPWLPWPPRPETHSARHIRLAEAAQAARAGVPDRVRILRTTVFVSKKEVHKLAVVRNRCRTRLLAALRDLVRADPSVPVCDRTCESDAVYVYVFLANAPLYDAPRDAVAGTLRRALAHVAAQVPP